MAGELITGVSCANNSTPGAIIIVVTIEAVAIAIVETISPSSVAGFTPHSPNAEDGHIHADGMCPSYCANTNRITAAASPYMNGLLGLNDDVLFMQRV